MPLWGWGDAEHSREMSAGAIANLEDRIGPVQKSKSRSDAGAGFDVPASNLSESLADGLRRLVTARGVLTDEPARLLRAHGKSYPDMLKMRAGRPGDVPDAAIKPTSREQLLAILEFCSRESIAVVPFGGGTSVVGGLAAASVGYAASISLDLGEMSGLEDFDQLSGVATFLPGTRGPEAELALSKFGFTLGHFPQSYEYGSIGGFVATRSAGQSSSGYGRIDANVIGLGAATPTGRIDIPAIPGTAAGPDLRQMLIGSEGTLGVLDKLQLQVVEAPSASRDLAWLAPSFEVGRNALRQIEQNGLAPTVARLSDPHETEITLMLAGDSKAAAIFRRMVALRGGGCLMITCFEGTPAGVEQKARQASDLLRRGGCRSMGTLPAKAWRKGRFSGPYLRDTLLDAGYFVETLETATTWANLEALYQGVSAALRAELGKAGGDPIVMCHLSHMYPTGASLYFTFVGNTPSTDLDERLAQWWQVKSAACDSIIQSGGTITHHHAVGRDHAPWLPAEIGERGIAVFGAVKAELDPNGIMNPGKVLSKTE
jgi:alkyldihydroxyacetonephosphate synthase